MKKRNGVLSPDINLLERAITAISRYISQSKVDQLTRTGMLLLVLVIPG